MKNRKISVAKVLVAATLMWPAAVLAQSAGHSSGGAGSASSSSTTTGIASGQAHISPPGTNSLGTANSSGVTTGMAVSEPNDRQRIDEQIRAEDAKVDSKINNICRGC